MKFMIAGLGSAGRRHFRNLLTLGERDILLYRSHRSTLPDDELAGFPVETELDAALAHHPDAVIVSNPSSLRLGVAIPAAEAGCHLLLEKPVSNDLAGLDRLEAAAAKNGCKVLVGYQFRYHPGIRRVKSWMDSGAIGKPVSARAHWGEYLPDWHPWEDYRDGYAARADLGGGVVLTLSHPLDYMRMLFGEIREISGITGSTGLGLDVEDTAEMAMRFDSGVIAGIHLNYNQRPPRHDLEIVGSSGTIRWDNADGSAHIYRADTRSWEAEALPEGFERNELFLDEMRNFLGMIRADEEPACSLSDGITVLRHCLDFIAGTGS